MKPSPSILLAAAAIAILAFLPAASAQGHARSGGGAPSSSSSQVSSPAGRTWSSGRHDGTTWRSSRSFPRTDGDRRWSRGDGHFRDRYYRGYGFYPSFWFGTYAYPYYYDEPRYYAPYYDPYWSYGYAYPPYVVPYETHPQEAAPYHPEATIASDAGFAFHVTPETATIVVDGNVVGEARDYDGPKHLLWLAPGRHQLVLRCAGHETLTTTLEVRGEDEPHTLHFTLSALGEKSEPRSR